MNFTEKLKVIYKKNEIRYKKEWELSWFQLHKHVLNVRFEEPWQGFSF